MPGERKLRRFRLVPAGPSRDVQRAIATTIHHLRRGDVRALAFVLVAPDGAVSTVFAGHHDGHYHTLNSGIATLRRRFDQEAD